jgi:hypothetical protein
MQLLLAIVLKIVEAVKKIFAFISKEFFFIFIYGISCSILTLILWGLLYIFPSNTKYNVYANLLSELNNSEKLLVAFLFAVSFGCIYLYRLLLAAVQGAVLK